MKRKTILVILIALAISACSRSRPEVKESAESDEKQSTAAEMSLEAQRHVGVQISPVSEGELKEYLQVTGTVQPIDSRIGHVRPLAKGRLQEV